MMVSVEELKHVLLHVIHLATALSESLNRHHLLFASDDRCASEWPTLPHFVAEYNLVKTCRELVKLPSSYLVDACCMENCNGDYPHEIAERKGYDQLAAVLVQTVKEHSKCE